MCIRDSFGGLVYRGLVAFSTEDQIAADPELMQGFVSATVSGYEDVIADPKSGLAALLAANPAIPVRFARESLNAYLPSFTAADGRFGSFADGDVRRLSAFMVDNGLADASIDPARYATNEFVDGAG